MRGGEWPGWGMAGGCGDPTCELAAQQLHPEGAVPPAHLWVQPDVLSLDGRREGVGVRGVVINVPAEHLRGRRAQKKMSGWSPSEFSCLKTTCFVLSVEGFPQIAAVLVLPVSKFSQQNVPAWCHIVMGLPPLPKRGPCLVTPRK